MTSHLLTLDSIGRDGILVNLETGRAPQVIEGRTPEALAGGRVGAYLRQAVDSDPGQLRDRGMVAWHAADHSPRR